MGYADLDRKYLERVNDDESLTCFPSGMYVEGVIKRCKLDLPQRIGHSLFLFGRFTNPEIIEVQPWAVGSDSPVRNGTGGRHSFACEESQNVHLGGICLSAAYGGRDITNNVLKGYFWKGGDQIITAMDSTEELIHSGDLSFDDMLAALAQSTRTGELLSSHIFHIGARISIHGGQIHRTPIMS